MAKPEHKQTSPKKSKSESPVRVQRTRKRRIGMWLAKAFGWFLSMALIGVVLIVIVGFVAFQNRERIVNRALGGLAENYEVHLEEINFPETGRVEIKGLYLTPKDAPADARPTRVKKLEITYDFKEVRESRKVKTITMIEPTIRVDDRTLRAFGIGEQKAADEDQKAAVDLSFLGKSQIHFS